MLPACYHSTAVGNRFVDRGFEWVYAPDFMVLPIAAGGSIALGWVLIGLGVISMAAGIAISAIVALRHPAVKTTTIGPSATMPWKEILDFLGAFLKALLAKEGAPTFFLGALSVAGGVLFLHYQPF